MASYVYGTSARKEALKVQPERPVEQSKELSQRVRQNRSRALHMNKGYVLFLAMAAFITLVACTKYLQLQSEITDRSERITALQQELADKKEANTTKYNAIVTSINLEEVRERAMNDLGMVYAQEEQVITYKNPANVSVRQYADIPESGVVASSEVVK